MHIYKNPLAGRRPGGTFVEILSFLARNPNRVSKDELVQGISGGAAITDDALTQTTTVKPKVTREAGSALTPSTDQAGRTEVVLPLVKKGVE